MSDEVLSSIFFLTGLTFSILIGREKGRLVEGIIMGFFCSWLGFVIIALFPDNPNKQTQQYKPGLPGAKPPPIANPTMGSVTCGCAVLITLGVFTGFMGLGMSSPSSDMGSFSNVLIFGTMLAVPGAVLTYSGLIHFGVKQIVATWCAGIYFAFVFGFTWIFLAQLGKDAVRIYGH